MPNWLQGYNTRRKLEIDHTKIDSDLTDFPVAVILNSSRHDFSKGNANGYDTRFTASDGETLLKYERERHDSTNQVAEYWVKIPSVSSSANTIFYFYYRTQTTGDGAEPTNVWDSDFAGVYHLKETGNGTSGEYKDSTANGRHGRGMGGIPSRIDGKIGFGQDFEDDNDEYIELNFPYTVLDDALGVTIEAFIKPESFASLGGIVSNIKSSNSQIGFSLTGSNPSYLRIEFQPKTGNFQSVIDNQLPINTNNWYYVAVVLYNNTATFFVNNQSSSYSTTFDRLWHETTSVPNMRIGLSNITYSSVCYDGIIDEVRISRTNRSSAWIKASYHSGNDSLLSYGEEETAEVIVQLPTQQLALSQQTPTIITQKNATALLDVLGLILEQKGINVIAIKNPTISLNALNLVLDPKNPTIIAGIWIPVVAQQLGLDLKIPTITTTKNPIVELPAQGLELEQLFPNVSISAIAELSTLNLETNQLLPQIIATKNPIIDLSSLNLSLLLKNPKIKSIAWKFKDRPEKDWEFQERSQKDWKFLIRF